MAKSFDVIVVGGGFVGCAMAYYLSRRGSKVLLLEAGELCGGSSKACAGRVQVIDSETEDYLDIVISGFEKIKTLGDELDCDLELDYPGHLTLIQKEQDWQKFVKLTDRLTRRGLLGEMLDRRSLAELEPCLNSELFLGASLSYEGHVNPFRFCLGYAGAARRLGAHLISFAPVHGMMIEGEMVTGVQTASEQYFGQKILLAGGAWTGRLAQLAGVDFPMASTHAEAFVTEKLSQVINHHIGMTGFYEAVHGTDRTVTLGVGQHRNGTLIVSNAIEKNDAIDLRSSDWGMPALARALRHYFPSLAHTRIVRTWAAPSPFLPDYNPAFGLLPGFSNLFVAAGLHLAIPTIPVLCEAAVGMVLEEERPSLLQSFTPARFSR